MTSVSEGLPLHTYNYTTVPEGLSSPGFPGQNILQQAMAWLIRKFRGVYQWIVGVREDGSIFKVPATVRGNQTYAYYQAVRLEKIQKKIDNITHIEFNQKKIYTNTALITFTQGYNPENAESINGTWEKTKNALIKFKRYLRKYGMTEYVMCLEAFESGACHGHITVIFNEKKEAFKYVGKDKKITYRFSDIDLIYRIKLAWAKALGRKMQEAQIDILACVDRKSVHYVTKELKKVNACEKALKKLEKWKGRKPKTKEEKKEIADSKKKVLAFYQADKNNMRLLYVSKGLGAGKEPDEGEMPENALVKNVISEPERVQRVLYTCVIKKSELLQAIKQEEISPYTGDVEKKTKEYDAIMRIFEERYKISTILGNEERIEEVIEEHRERKEIRGNTKLIAQEAIDE
jgi:hypothetical protein